MAFKLANFYDGIPIFFGQIIIFHHLNYSGHSGIDLSRILTNQSVFTHFVLTPMKGSRALEMFGNYSTSFMYLKGHCKRTLITNVCLEKHPSLQVSFCFIYLFIYFYLERITTFIIKEKQDPAISHFRNFSLIHDILGRLFTVPYFSVRSSIQRDLPLMAAI